MTKGVWDNPWHWECYDYLRRKISIDIFIDVATLAIINPGLTGSRDVGCLYDRVVIGRVEDGTRRVFAIPEGSFSVSRQKLATNGFSIITDVTDGGFTVGTQETITS